MNSYLPSALGFDCRLRFLRALVAAEAMGCGQPLRTPGHLDLARWLASALFVLRGCAIRVASGDSGATDRVDSVWNLGGVVIATLQCVVSGRTP